MRPAGPTPKAAQHSRHGDGLPPRSPVSGWAIAAVLAVAALLVYSLRYALMPFVLAMAIAFVVEPATGWLTPRLGDRRWIAALLLYLVLLAAIGAGAYWIGAVALSDLEGFAARVPALARELLTRLLGPAGIELFGERYTPDAILHRLGEGLGGAVGIGVAATAAGFGMAALFGGILTLVLLAYFMISGPRLAAGAIWLIPPERRAAATRLLPRIIPALRRYLLGVLAVVAYTAALAWIALDLILNLPHAPILAIAVGIFEMIPVVGPAASAALVGITAFEQHTMGTILGLIGFVVFLRVTVDNLVGPIVLGQAGRIHPVVVILSFIVGGMLFGIIGLILGVPTAVCLKIVLQHYYAEPVAEARQR